MVAFIGNDIKEQFFPKVDPVGKTIAINGRPFEVIGVAKTLGSVFGQSRDNFVMIPIETYFKMFGARNDWATWRWRRARTQSAQGAGRDARAAARLPASAPGAGRQLRHRRSDSLMQAWEQLTGAIAATAMAIVSVFMVVGGVVIMNIMLAVVTERTHEIGIRKSRRRAPAATF